MKTQVDHLVQNPPFPRNYSSTMVIIDHGEGSYVFDEGGNRYLDFGAGISVNALGYGREDIAEVMSRQARRMIHTSNLYAHRPGIELGRRLLASTPFQIERPMAAVHFGNSGTEANEAALKYARLYAYETKGPGHHKILSFSHGFHGRTLGALSATPKPKYKTKFEPLVPGFVTTAYNDVAELETTLSDEFAAVIVEVVQGEGGLSVLSPEFTEALNTLTRKYDIMLVADEVQTGLGRTGTLYACESAELKPDIITLAKPLAAGLPLSATLIPPAVNDLLHIGDHGTTFGGGPVTTAVALHVLDVLSQPGFLGEVQQKAEYLHAKLAEISTELHGTPRVLGRGMLTGIPVGADDDETLVGEVMRRCQDNGLLVLRSGVNALRIAPPLTISQAEIDEGLAIIRSSISQAKGDNGE